jgi:protein O-GlcNAc transferase
MMFLRYFYIRWSGTPLLTIAGEKMAQRVGHSLLHSLGLAKQLSAHSLQDYEDKAVQLATDTDALYALRRHIEDVRDTVATFDTPRWVRNFETGLNSAWKRFETGMNPDHIEVEDKAALYEAYDGAKLI